MPYGLRPDQPSSSSPARRVRIQSQWALVVPESVDALGAVVTVAQKEPFLTDAGPTSHRVRLWRGGSASNLGGWRSCSCSRPSLRTAESGTHVIVSLDGRYDNA